MKNKSKDFSIIDTELTVDGTISTKGRLIIKGTVKGTLHGENVIIAKEGVVDADTKVASMTIGGTFKGEIEASEELVILSTGNCSGKVVCKKFVVAAGGIINAAVSCVTNQNAKKKEG